MLEPSNPPLFVPPSPHLLSLLIHWTDSFFDSRSLLQSPSARLDTVAPTMRVGPLVGSQVRTLPPSSFKCLKCGSIPFLRVLSSPWAFEGWRSPRGYSPWNFPASLCHKSMSVTGFSTFPRLHPKTGERLAPLYLNRSPYDRAVTHFAQGLCGETVPVIGIMGLKAACLSEHNSWVTTE
jgi:hypothetical protein